jgi:Protein of unknown function (DUF3034)
MVDATGRSATMTPARHLTSKTAQCSKRACCMPLFVMLVTLLVACPTMSAAQAVSTSSWSPSSAIQAADASRGKLAAFMSRWSFKLSHQLAEPVQETRLLGSDIDASRDAAQAPAKVEWQVSVQTQGNDGKALVRSLGAVNGGDVDLFASVSRFWVGSDSTSRFMATAAARLARDDLSVWHAPYHVQGRARRLQLEGGLGWLVRDDVVAGASYRVKSPATDLPSLQAPTLDEGWDVFVAWMPWWGGALTMAWVNMPSGPGQARTGGAFLSGQIAY